MNLINIGGCWNEGFLVLCLHIYVESVQSSYPCLQISKNKITQKLDKYHVLSIKYHVLSIMFL